MDTRERGATLIEGLGFVVIAVLFILAAVALYQMAFKSSTSQTMVRELNALQQKIHSLFRNQSNYSVLSPERAEPLLIDAEAIPESLFIAPGASAPNQVRNQFGGHVDFQPATALGSGISLSDPEGTGADDQRFYIIYMDVPEDVCINVASTVGKPFNQVMILNADGSTIRFTATKDNAFGNADFDGKDPTNYPGLPVEASIAQAACVEGSGLAYYSP